MAHVLPELPYAQDALAPHISAETLEYHYGKHHQAYVNNLNGLVEGTEYAGKSLEDIVKSAPAGGLFNNAAQVWNHTFYFMGLSPKGGGEPSGALGDAIKKSFGSFDAFKEQFSKSAATNFGSGWTWLVKNSKGGLEIVNTNAFRAAESVVLFHTTKGCDEVISTLYMHAQRRKPALQFLVLPFELVEAVFQLFGGLV